MAIQERLRDIFPAWDDVPVQFRIPSPVELRENLIAGELRHVDGAFEEVYSPVCIRSPAGLQRQRIGSFPLMTEVEALEVLNAAVAAYDNGRGLWPTMTVGKRIRHVQLFAARMKERRDDVVRLLMWEIGKTLKDAEKEFDRTLTYIADTVDALKDLDRSSSRFTIAEGIIGQIRRAPLGVTLCMGPYNYPLNESLTTLIPALIMGNTAVLKPPRHGVLLFAPMLEAFREAFPPGVVNTLFGKGRTVTPPLMRSGKVDALAFIGTSKAANALLKEHPKPNRLRLVLGLEAKNPAIILPDADLDLAVAECLAGSLSFNGQRCTALKILFVHEQLAKDFIARFSQGLDTIGSGMPWEPGAMLTPLPEREKPGYLTELIADAQKFGAEVVNQGGGTVHHSFFHPALLYPVNQQMRVFHEEQFGPLIPVVPFTAVETPIRYIEESTYGQQVSIFGRDPELLAKLIDPLVNQVSRVNLNSQCQRGPDVFPFTGRKDSAVSTLSVSDALRAFSIRAIVAAKELELNRQIITEITREHRSNFLSTDFIL